MFGSAKKIKELEGKIAALQDLCALIVNNSVALTKEYTLLTEAIKNIMEHQQVLDALIDNKYKLAPLNDDDDILN
jgi:hypothetical protein